MIRKLACKLALLACGELCTGCLAGIRVIFPRWRKRWRHRRIVFHNRGQWGDGGHLLLLLLLLP